MKRLIMTKQMYYLKKNNTVEYIIITLDSELII